MSNVVPMSLVAEVEIDTPILRRALEAVPDMTLEFEDFQTVPEGELKYVVWASGDDFGAFEAGLAADPTVGRFRLLAEVLDRRLYRITLSEAGRSASTYFAAIRHDAVVLDLIAAGGTMTIQARIPDRSVLLDYRDTCRDLGIPFRLKRLYEEDPGAGGGSEQYGVTSAQREALLAALERGYFSLPRETTLEEIAADLGITEQALSARLRRGQANLVENTLASGPTT